MVAMLRWLGGNMEPTGCVSRDQGAVSERDLEILYLHGAQLPEEPVTVPAAVEGMRVTIAKTRFARGSDWRRPKCDFYSTA